MRQEINLYQSVFRRKKDPFRSLNLLLIVCLVLAACGFLWGLKASEVSSLKDQTRAADQRRHHLQGQIRKLEAEHPVQTVNPRLKSRVAALRQGRESRLRLLATLEERIPESEQGFSAYLRGLARQRVQGVWLSSFEISLKQTEKLLLEGQASQAELLPRYLQRLSREGSFAGVAFERMRLKRVEGRQEVIRFSLATHKEARP